MSVAETRMWELVEAAARTVTDELTGRFENKHLVDEVRTRLSDDDLQVHVRAVAADRLAESLARSFVRSRNPKPGRPSGMFHPGAILSLGDGKRIWMEHANDRDLIEWGRLSTKNLARVATAEGSRQQYVAERLDAFLSHRDWLLGRIEREVFGYVDTEEPPEYVDPDEDDDNW